jgi:predicted patatin/cPLA2 family phospholipase
MTVRSNTETAYDTRGLALVLEGGGFRGIFTAAVLDAFQESGLLFEYLIGVSAGAAYSVSYVSRQFRRNLAVNKYVNDKRYCGHNQWFKKGNYFNWDFIYHQIPTKIIPFDYKSFNQSSSRLKVVVTDIKTGCPEYQQLRTDQPEVFRDWLTATSALPLISKPQAIDGKLYMDGGLCDSIPVDHALADGNNRAVVVLTRPFGYRKKPLRHGWIFRLFYRKYPRLVECIQRRNQEYNRTLDHIEQLEQAGTIFVIRPQTVNGVSRLENDPARLHEFYEQSLVQIKKEFPRLKTWLCGE